MPTRELDQVIERPVAPVPVPASIGQMTAVEQARAVAEVQAAVVVAQQVPRDMGRARAEMRDACGQLGLANRAFYSVPNRGSGPTVHLMRELARIFGNVQYGVHELRRDDDAHASEVQAFAWDVERNTRSTRTLIIPHARMVKPKGAAKAYRDPLTDLGDIYLNNQNIGARAVRECIATILPVSFTDEAQDLCRATLENGEGKSIEERIDEMVRGFAAIEVTVAQLEAKIGRKRGSWGPGDVAQMGIVFRSIQRHETSREDEFPQKRVTAEEITEQNGVYAAGGAEYDPAKEPTSWRTDPEPTP